jgi:uncharacterized protein YdiU (UPF0061 family)
MDLFFQQSYLTLPDAFYVQMDPLAVKNPEMVVWNESLAKELGIAQDVHVFGGNQVLSSMKPLAQAYAGHQFGHLTMLGDGRAILLGEASSANGTKVDIQLKGSGRTPFSRGGDGRAALEPMLREYLISEAMHALGIPTTRSLAVVSTGEEIMRESGFLPGAVLTRVAASHLRVGTFEFAAHLDNPKDLRSLIAFALKRHDPDRSTALEFFRGVMERQASLVAQWMGVGFVHGVMNTDNIAISGETIDYGPCAFMDRYDPETLFSSIDQQGRYAYGNQPHITQWNLAALAGALLPAIDADASKAEAQAREVLDEFPAVFRQEWQKIMNAKIGLETVKEGDDTLVAELLDLMLKTRSDYTNTFCALNPSTPLPGFEDWHATWCKRCEGESNVLERMHETNPAVIPRNHKVEAALQAAGEGDLSTFNTLLDFLSDPYNRSRDYGDLAEAPPPDAPAYKTFCGT